MRNETLAPAFCLTFRTFPLRISHFAMSIHRPLDEELKVLRELVLEMSYLVDEQLAEAMNALTKGDVELAQRVRHRDDEIDALEMKLDRQCERILALHHPVASDLRLIILAVKVNTDLERIGDHSKNLAKNVAHVKDMPDVLKATRLPEMADAARAMLREAQDAFSTEDRVRAREILARDRQVDRLHKENFAALVKYGQEHPECMTPVAHLITASKGLERISDHVKNIAESIIFLIEGLDIRHKRLARHDD